MLIDDVVSFFRDCNKQEEKEDENLDNIVVQDRKVGLRNNHIYF